ncbi:nucleoside phosphatase family-domain-containing protein [Tuber indicum]|nr:nucleoside phosphatase family-domain-containing protein [Tuber indicum]
MSSARRRPSLWSHFSFQRKPARSSSISSQLRPSDDRYEKSGRHAELNPAFPSMSNRWLKTLSVAVIFALALFILAPKDKSSATSEYVGDELGFLADKTQNISNSRVIPNTNPTTPASSGQGQVALDDESGTKSCTRSSSPKKPIVQYAIMVDAGSTGSRIHVYRFNNCGATPELESEEFKMITPGLSSYKADSEAAAKSLDTLLEVAVEKVPDKLKGCTPIAVKATAGLRLLGDEMSRKTLDAVRQRLETRYPFPVVAGDGVSIMEGKDEGVYAWITTNYLLGKIGGPEDTPTAAIFDLGGGSTQIVFQPTFPSSGGGMPEHLAPGDHKYALNFGGRNFDLYQHSHLGYGLMEARRSIHKLLAETQKKEGGEDWANKPIVNPCIIPGMSREVTVKMGDDEEVKLNMTGPSEPSMPQCRYLAETTLKKGKECKLTPCSFNGVHQPSLARTFAKEDVYIFSYFFDRTRPLGMPDSFTLKEMTETTTKVCGGKDSWDVFQSIDGAMAELLDRPEYCLDLNFMLALLHTGYEMPLDREVKIAKKIKGNELGWCLGASLPLLDQGNGGWQCRIRESS